MSILLGVLSDTHGHLPRTEQAVQRLADLKVDLVIHCGDVGSPALVDLFASWPTHFVFGNIDDPKSLGEAIRRAGQHNHGRFGSLGLEGRAVAFLHGDDRKLLQEAFRGDRWDLVCYGHTHVAEVASRERTTVLNPGALYRTPQPTVAVVRLPALEVRLITVPA